MRRSLRIGPSASPPYEATVATLIASPRRLTGARSATTVYAATTNAASPAPATKRITVSAASEGSRRSASEQASTTADPPTRTIRRPYQSPKRPLGGPSSTALTLAAPTATPIAKSRASSMSRA